MEDMVALVDAAEGAEARPLQAAPAEGRGMKAFDWHSDPITRETPITPTYRNTQNVRRFLKAQCGQAFRFDRSLMQWIKDGTRKTMGDVADEWLRRRFQTEALLARR